MAEIAFTEVLDDTAGLVGPGYGVSRPASGLAGRRHLRMYASFTGDDVYTLPDSFPSPVLLAWTPDNIAQELGLVYHPTLRQIQTSGTGAMSGYIHVWV